VCRFYFWYNKLIEKVSIFIDAGNFYHLALKKMGVLEIDFDFEKFVNFLAGERNIIRNGKNFYVGTVREKGFGHETKKAMSNQNLLFSSLIKNRDWKIKTSKLRTRLEKIKIDSRVKDFKRLKDLGITEIKYQRSREKGIDVWIAVDLIEGAVENKYDTAILISSDTDLVPAIDFVRKRYKKKVEYVGFSMLKTNKHDSSRPVKRLIYSTDIQRVLVESDIKSFIQKKLI